LRCGRQITDIAPVQRRHKEVAREEHGLIIP
jgi:hypothetical protein